MKTALQELLEWMNSQMFIKPKDLYSKVKELLPKEKEQTLLSFGDGYINGYKNKDNFQLFTAAEDYFEKKYQKEQEISSNEKEPSCLNGKWELIVESSQIADTGDYGDPLYLITNGEISLHCTDDVEENSDFDNLINALNSLPYKLQIDDSWKWELELQKKEVKRLYETLNSIEEKESFITFETAKLAKEKGFDVINLNDEFVKYYFENYYNDGRYKLTVGLVNNKEEHVSLCVTQSILQKWLRDIHKIEIEIKAVLYGYDYCIWERKNEDIGEEINYKSGLKTYEKTLEKALFESLKLI
jgi:hypothetical protein